MAGPYQRLVKTTPKPKATKKSRGELVGPLLLEPPPPVDDAEAADAEVEEGVGNTVVEGTGDACLLSKATSYRASTVLPSTISMTAMMVADRTGDARWNDGCAKGSRPCRPARVPYRKRSTPDPSDRAPRASPTNWVEHLYRGHEPRGDRLMISRG